MHSQSLLSSPAANTRPYDYEVHQRGAYMHTACKVDLSRTSHAIGPARRAHKESGGPVPTPCINLQIRSDACTCHRVSSHARDVTTTQAYETHEEKAIGRSTTHRNPVSNGKYTQQMALSMFTFADLVVRLRSASSSVTAILGLSSVFLYLTQSLARQRKPQITSILQIKCSTITSWNQILNTTSKNK